MIDTFTVVGLLCVFDILPWAMFLGLVISGFLFKVFIAVLDTPLLYFFVYILKKRFKLEVNEEIELAVYYLQHFAVVSKRLIKKEEPRLTVGWSTLTSFKLP